MHIAKLDAEAHGQVQPVPSDWAPQLLEQKGGVLKWEGRVQLDGKEVALEVGLRPRTPEDRVRDLQLLHKESWILTELARLGRSDLLAPFRKDRHRPSLRPVSVPDKPKA
jgi:hypothetical protein